MNHSSLPADTSGAVRPMIGAFVAFALAAFPAAAVAAEEMSARDASTAALVARLRGD